MFNLNLFIILLFVIGLTAVFLVFYTHKNMNENNIKKIEKIPRNVLLGVIFAIIDILWCTPQAVEIFSQSSTLLIWGIAIAALVVGCIFLDYLFARALAGFLILLAHYFLRASFATDLPLIWLFSILCLLFGIAGIFFGGMPHLFRDMLRKICSSKKWKKTFIGIFSAYAVVMFVAGIFLIVQQSNHEILKMNIDDYFTAYFSVCGVKDISIFLEKITKFKNFLSEENKKHNLTRIESDDDFWNKHVCDSLSIAKLFPEIAKEQFTVLDIGCGAGFPSFVLAAAFENLTITAIDSVGKKTDFLKKASDLIGLQNLKVIHARSKEYKTEEKFDIITARAVAEIFKIFKESKKLLEDNGRYILYKTPENIHEDLLKTNKLSTKLKFVWKKTDDFVLPAGDGRRLFVIGERVNTDNLTRRR